MGLFDNNSQYDILFNEVNELKNRFINLETRLKEIEATLGIERRTAKIEVETQPEPKKSSFLGIEWT